ncbi:MAG TPA: FtsK/SpoIIIE domain-containing protein [Bacillales bacterium]|nr:FtsK/SpoIIIE domain-containing protein [Bacillales bacterium]
MKWLRKQKLRGQLLGAFNRGGMYVKGPNDRPIYPIIHSVREDDGRREFVFTLPLGLDPGLLHRNDYVFHQQFGANIELKGEYKRFVLTVHNGLPVKVTYNWGDVASIISGMSLPIVCGINLRGEMVAYDMVSENRAGILIAGEPGAGKSTALRQILCTLIQSLGPQKLRLYLADLKRSEFHIFRGIAHTEGVYTTEEELLPALKTIKKEIARRGNLLDKAGLSHVDDLDKQLPYIVLCIDEYSLLKDNKEIEKIVGAISSLGRALGIYIIVSMQRPSYDLIPTKIRAMLSTRMGFRVADADNAKMIGTPGAENVVNPGRMICKIEKTEELQAPLLTIASAKQVLAPYKVERPAGKRPANVEVSNTNEPVFGVLDDDLT